MAARKATCGRVSRLKSSAKENLWGHDAMKKENVEQQGDIKYSIEFQLGAECNYPMGQGFGVSYR
jgi:hypothetical protein